MGAESREKTGKSDGNGATPDPIAAERRQELNERLELTPAQIELVESLGTEQREHWYRLVEGWFAPERWLASADEKARERQPVAAFHIPTAEGIATYRGLSERDRALAVSLLERAILGQGEGHSDRGNGNGNGGGPADGEPDPRD